jgi:hypothetical protein
MAGGARSIAAQHERHTEATVNIGVPQSESCGPKVGR